MSETSPEPADEVVVAWSITGTATAYATHPEGAILPDTAEEQE